MAAVEIRYITLLLPLTKATQLMTLLQSAVLCDEDYSSGQGKTYTIGDQPEVQMTTVRPSQMRFKPAPGTNGDLLALENNPSASLNF